MLRSIGIWLAVLAVVAAMAAAPEISYVHPDYPVAELYKRTELGVPQVITGEGFDTPGFELWCWTPDFNEKRLLNVVKETEERDFPHPEELLAGDDKDPNPGRFFHKITPLDVEAQVAVANMALDSPGDGDTAMKLLTADMREYPTMVESHRALVYGYMQRKDFDNALEHIHRAVAQEDIDAAGSTPASLVTKFQYDPNQNLIQTTKPEGNIVEFDYDERNLRIATRVGRDATTGEPGASLVMRISGRPTASAACSVTSAG